MSKALRDPNAVRFVRVDDSHRPSTRAEILRRLEVLAAKRRRKSNGAK